MKNHSEGPIRTAYDVAQELMLMQAIDPRPIVVGSGPELFVQYMEAGGFLPANLSGGERQHLLHKLDNMVNSAVYQDRKDRIVP
jgi:hypothetical protein